MATTKDIVNQSLWNAGGFKNAAEGYAASIRQQADWIQEAQDGVVPMHQRVDIGDVDVDELRAAADFIEQQHAEIESLRAGQALGRE